MDNSIIDFLSTENTRIENGGKWLVVDGDTPNYVFTVYKQNYKKLLPIILYEGTNLEKALQALRQE